MMQRMIQYLFRNRRIFIIFLFTAMLSAHAVAEGGDEGGEGPEGSESSNEGGGEGREGPEGGNDSDSNNVPFISNGLSLGVFESPTLALNETFAGLFNDTEIAITFDEANEKFIGRIRNEGLEPVCDVNVAVMLDDGQVINTTLSGKPLQIDGLLTGGRQDFEFPVAGTTFNGEHRSGASWTAMVETFACDSAPTVTAGGAGPDDGSGGCGGIPEGPKGGNESGGSEGPEGGNEAGGESGDESSPPIPLSDSFSGVFQNQNFNFAFDASTGAFRGTVENPTNNFICQSRTEIHLGVGTQVIELGPTIPENLGPGKTLNVVVFADGVAPDTYTLHPESSPCP